MFHTTVDGSTVENEAEYGSALKKVNVNKALGSVSKIVENGNRVVFDASGSYTENKMSKDILWLLEVDGQERDQKCKPPIGRQGLSRDREGGGALLLCPLN